MYDCVVPGRINVGQPREIWRDQHPGRRNKAEMTYVLLVLLLIVDVTDILMLDVQCSVINCVSA
jgi:hypothetical protein